VGPFRVEAAGTETVCVSAYSSYDTVSLTWRDLDQVVSSVLSGSGLPTKVSGAMNRLIDIGALRYLPDDREE